MKCKFCGADILEGATVCRYCDHSIYDVLESNVVVNQPQVQPVVQPQVQVNAPVSNNVTSFNNKLPKKKKPILLILIILLVVGVIASFVIGGIVTSLNKDDESLEFSSKKEIKVEDTKTDRVIMMYIIGSNLESDYGAATADLTEILDSNFNQDDIDVIAYVGGTKKWKNKIFSEEENAIYEINNEEFVKVESYEKKKMTEASTLTEFLDYVYNNYDANNYSLILWDHGSGPLFGYGIDENFSDNSMSIIDIDKAINDSKILEKGKLEFIGFDACLMSSIEIASMLKEEADYLIASSEIEPGTGWDYSFLENINRKTSTVQFGEYVIDYYIDSFDDSNGVASLFGYDYTPDLSLTLIDLSKVSEINNSINELFKYLDEDINIENYSIIARDASKATSFALNENGVSQFDLMDIYDFTNELVGYDSLVKPLQKAIDDAVVYHKTNIDGCYGLSIYFPSLSRKYYSEFETTYNYDKIAVSENYRSFLVRYSSISSGEKIVKTDISTISPSISSSDIQVVLPDDIASNYEYMDYLLFRKIKDNGSYIPVLKSKDVSIDGNVVKANLSNKRVTVINDKGEISGDIIAYEVSRDDSSVTYVMNGVLQKWDDEDYINTFDVAAVSIYLKVDNNTGEGSIIDIKTIIDDNVSGGAKVTYNLNEWRYMSFSSSSYYLYDSNGNKLDSWNKTDTMYGTEINISEGYKFKMDSLDENEEYYYMFRVKDTQGNIYESDLVKAN